ncbi:hypothetical protein [Acidithiobacillus caldus]|uniref:hypothetical protein n=1 Tax=Acidithiobacillus caldus TaxID=33059 RepID=UPI001C064494|nr:hypothetical protein [Acidithiobacillus caldus]MBU2728970.1 hypothetical protein [Acidithiobacillus caldus]MBU2780455.1 hypothetical protein [Acidithiobacillus caldus]
MYPKPSTNRLRALMALAGLLVGSGAVAAPYDGNYTTVGSGSTSGMIPWQGDTGPSAMPAPSDDSIPSRGGVQSDGTAPEWNGIAQAPLAPRAEAVAYVPPPPGPYPVYLQKN